ncbi:MAG: hypothetical protein ISS16_04575 [Ignavibacteria bacterium]|nr:hypothetical protein [Ignavibacteria bacterium]
MKRTVMKTKLIIIIVPLLLLSCVLFLPFTLYEKNFKSVHFIGADDEGNYIIVYDSVRYDIDGEKEYSGREKVNSLMKKISYKSQTHIIRDTYLDANRPGKYYLYNNKFLYWEPDIKEMTYLLRYKISDSITVDTPYATAKTNNIMTKIFYDHMRKDSVYLLKENPILVMTDTVILNSIFSEGPISLSYDYKKFLKFDGLINHRIKYFSNNKFHSLGYLYDSVKTIQLPILSSKETDFYVEDDHSGWEWLNLKYVYWFKDNKKYLVARPNEYFFRVGNIETGEAINISINMKLLDEIFYIYMITSDKFLYAYYIDKPPQRRDFRRIGLATMSVEGIFND